MVLVDFWALTENITQRQKNANEIRKPSVLLDTLSSSQSTGFGPLCARGKYVTSKETAIQIMDSNLKNLYFRVSTGESLNSEIRLHLV